MINLSKAFLSVKDASIELPFIEHSIKQKILLDLAKRIIENKESILKNNEEDLKKLDKQDPKYDRLLLNDSRLNAMSEALEKIAQFDSPIWKTIEQYTLANGLKFQKKTVPLGVVGIIYESRPNVTLEAFALCFMSSNACVLKGGSEAKNSNEIFVRLAHASLEQFLAPKTCVFLMPHDRETVKTLLQAKGIVDVIIPRGSQALIDFVKQNSEIPIIETGAGVVHTYFDSSADREKGKRIITNAKTRRVSVCNALDCLLIHQERLSDLPFLVSDLKAKGVVLLVDDSAYSVLHSSYPEQLLFKAQPSDYGKEFLSLKLAIKTVVDLSDALKHIRHYSSQHSEAIIAEDEKVVLQFFERVDAAVVYSNASTAFTDGGEFGMGGEIGISTQKLHVRGPFSLQHLVSTKWLVEGDGQVRK